MKCVTSVFLGILLATSLEKVHSDNEYNQQHRKDEAVTTNLGDIMGEGSVRARRKSGSNTDEADAPLGEGMEMRGSRRDDRKRESNKEADDSDEKRAERTDNKRQERGNKRGGGDDEKTQEVNDEKRRGGGGGGRARKQDKKEQEGNSNRESSGGENEKAERKKNKRGNRIEDNDSTSEKQRVNKNKLRQQENKERRRNKTGRKYRKRLDQMQAQVPNSDGVAVVEPALLVGGGVSSPTEVENEHEVKRESQMMAKSEKEPVTEDVEVGVPVVQTADTVVTTTNTKRKQRYEKKPRRQHHQGPRPPVGGTAGRFAVPPPAGQKKARGSQHQNMLSKTDKIAPSHEP